MCAYKSITEEAERRNDMILIWYLLCILVLLRLVPTIIISVLNVCIVVKILTRDRDHQRQRCAACSVAGRACRSNTPKMPIRKQRNTLMRVLKMKTVRTTLAMTIFFVIFQVTKDHSDKLFSRSIIFLQVPIITLFMTTWKTIGIVPSIHPLVVTISTAMGPSFLVLIPILHNFRVKCLNENRQPGTPMVQFGIMIRNKFYICNNECLLK